MPRIKSKKTKILRYRESGSSQRRRRMTLAVSKDPRMLAYLIILVMFFPLLTSSLYFLPIQNLTGDNALNYNYNLSQSSEATLSVPLYLTPGSHEHIAFNVTKSGYATYRLEKTEKSLFGSGSTVTVSSGKWVGQGNYSYTNSQNRDEVTLYVNMYLYPNNDSVLTQLNITASGVYSNNVNPLILGAAIIDFAVFGVAMGARITHISRNPEKYWYNLEKLYHPGIGKRRFVVVPFKKFPKKEWHISAPLLFAVSLVFFSLEIIQPWPSFLVSIINLILTELAVGFLVASIIIMVLNIIVDEDKFPTSRN